MLIRVKAERRSYLIASCSMGLGCITGSGVLVLTTLAWAHLSDSPQVPTILFFIAMGLLAYGCHRLDCLESARRKEGSL